MCQRATGPEGEFGGLVGEDPEPGPQRRGAARCGRPPLPVPKTSSQSGAEQARADAQDGERSQAAGRAASLIWAAARALRGG